MDNNKISTATIDDIPPIKDLINSGFRGEYSKKGWTTEADLIVMRDGWLFPRFVGSFDRDKVSTAVSIDRHSFLCAPIGVVGELEDMRTNGELAVLGHVLSVGKSRHNAFFKPSDGQVVAKIDAGKSHPVPPFKQGSFVNITVNVITFLSHTTFTLFLLPTDIRINAPLRHGEAEVKKLAVLFGNIQELKIDTALKVLGSPAG
jgi:hypothetical protein